MGPLLLLLFLFSCNSQKDTVPNTVKDIGTKINEIKSEVSQLQLALLDKEKQEREASEERILELKEQEKHYQDRLKTLTTEIVAIEKKIISLETSKNDLRQNYQMEKIKIRDKLRDDLDKVEKEITAQRLLIEKINLGETAGPSPASKK